MDDASVGPLVGAQVGSLIGDIRAGLRAAADPERAPGMQAYMKSAMPYLGVPMPMVRKIVASAVRRPDGAPSGRVLLEGAGALWRSATHREERYAAAALTRLKSVTGDLGFLPLYREMIVTGAWWDHVDETSHRIGDLLLAHPAVVRPMLIQWATDPDLWLRRASIICQLGHRARTDLALLETVIEPNLPDRQFFIRKAIGWALRDYAWTDPGWVHAFVDRHRPGLSPLSIREALKNVGASASP